MSVFVGCVRVSLPDTEYSGSGFLFVHSERPPVGGFLVPPSGVSFCSRKLLVIRLMTKAGSFCGQFQIIFSVFRIWKTGISKQKSSRYDWFSVNLEESVSRNAFFVFSCIMLFHKSVDTPTTERVL